MTLLGYGPIDGGWPMRADIVFECTRCKGQLSGDPTVSGQCACGAMSKDADAGRLGSRHGDLAIAVYRR